jgi:hypothetical protein
MEAHLHAQSQGAVANDTLFSSVPSQRWRNNCHSGDEGQVAQKPKAMATANWAAWRAIAPTSQTVIGRAWFHRRARAAAYVLSPLSPKEQSSGCGSTEWAPIAMRVLAISSRINA